MKKAEKSLNEYEEKLGLLDKLLKTEKGIVEIEASIDNLIKDHNDDKKLCEKLTRIKDIIENIS